MRKVFTMDLMQDRETWSWSSESWLPVFGSVTVTLTISMLPTSSEMGEPGLPHGQVAHESSPSLWKQASR